VRIFNHSREGEVMGDVTTVGIDLAKNVFSVHGVDNNGREVLRPGPRMSEPRLSSNDCNWLAPRTTGPGR